MITLSEITKFLDTELKIAEIEDCSLNGLQVEGKNQIRKAGFAVDASYETLLSAKEAAVDMLIVHHGIFWEKQEAILGPLYQKLKVLIENGISLYAAHLPLDIHPDIGNNAQIAKIVLETSGKQIGDYGYIAEVDIKLSEVVNRIESRLKTKCKVYSCGKENLKKVALSSGGGASMLSLAIKEGACLFITGEPRLSSYHLAKEAGINLIFCGHYATETLGIKALSLETEKRFDVECLFLDLPVDI
jgi:dinuclear metal center YbgI/SA1388 family protein